MPNSSEVIMIVLGFIMFVIAVVIWRNLTLKAVIKRRGKEQEIYTRLAVADQKRQDAINRKIRGEE